MKTKIAKFIGLAVCMIGTLTGRIASAQVVPPFGIASTQPSTAYQHGYADGQLPATRPALSVIPVQPIDKSYVIAPTGSGTYPSFPAAIAQAQKDKAQWPAFNFQPGHTYFGSWLLPKGFLGISISGGTSLNNCATITSDATGNGKAALSGLAIPNVHVSYLVVTGQPSAAQPVPPQGFYTNGVSGWWFDHVIVNGFAIAITPDGTSVNCHITHSGIFDQSAPQLGKSQGCYWNGENGWTIEDVIFYHCGWFEGDYNPKATGSALTALNNKLQLNRGAYIDKQNSAGDGAIRACIFAYCASNGIGTRVGGIYDYSIFEANGLSFDVIVQGVSASVLHSAFFGPAVDQPPYFGGGIQGISQHLIVDDCYFFCSAITPRNPAVAVDWPASNGPMPAGMTASVTNLHGDWMCPAISIVAGRTATQSTINLQVPKAGKPEPSLETYYGCTRAQLETVLRSRVGMSDAIAIEDYARRSSSN